MNIFVIFALLIVVVTSYVCCDPFEPESFPHLLGKTVTEAREYFRTRPELQPQFLVQGSRVTEDFGIYRVRVYYDPETNRVTEVPSKG